VKAYRVAELDDRIAPVDLDRLSDAELMRIARGGSSENTTPRMISIRSG
jgi:hypothetical protein